MKEVKFRPLRRIKKTGKIVVSSYMEWNKVRCADYSQFTLIINEEYKLLPRDEFVYNHKGELLYFFDYNPDEVPVYHYDIESILNENWLETIRDTQRQYGIKWGSDNKPTYRMDGTDCVGTPTFSHFTQEYVSEYFCNHVGGFPERIFDFNPLTVETVKKWFGWFLWQLNNSYLQVK